LRIPRDGENVDPEDTYDFSMKQDEIDVSQRWKRLNSVNKVFVDDSVPSTAIHTTNDLFAVAANALELQNGGLRVNGLTLLPPNPIFLLLSLLSFGLEISSPMLWTISNEEDGTQKKIGKAFAWLKNHTIKVSKAETSGDKLISISVSPVTDGNSPQTQTWEKEELKEKFEQAVAFNESSLSLGEKLVCFPERISEFCKLFDGTDGHNISPWESLEEEALTLENLSKWQKERKSTTKQECRQHAHRLPVDTNGQAAPSEVSTNTTREHQMTTSENKSLKSHKLYHFDKRLILMSKKWFSTSLTNGETMPAFPSTNILALLFQLFENEVVGQDGTVKTKSSFKLSLNTKDWDVTCFTGENGNILYSAHFVNCSIGNLPVLGRGKNNLPKWVKKNRGRPTSTEEAKQCVPPNVVCPNIIESDSDGLLFESIEDALKMESAFWMNQQFCHAGKSWTRHWYAHSMDQMIGMLQKPKGN